jgi:hypothetical protein
MFKEAKKLLSVEELAQLGKRMEQRKAEVIKELKRSRTTA